MNFLGGKGERYNIFFVSKVSANEQNLRELTATRNEKIRRILVYSRVVKAFERH
jgi:hypothetical protein